MPEKSMVPDAGRRGMSAKARETDALSTTEVMDARMKRIWKAPTGTELLRYFVTDQAADCGAADGSHGAAARCHAAGYTAQHGAGSDPHLLPGWCAAA